MDTTPQKLTIFLCHASEDKPKVRELYTKLLSDGYDIWLDEEKLFPGHDWRNEITKAVRVSNVVIVCLSRKSVNKEGFVQKEINFALDVAEEKPENAIFIIPAKLEKCKVPDRLSKWQWVDLFSENGYKKLKLALDLRYENLHKRKRRIKQSLNLSKEEAGSQSSPINLVKKISIDETLPLDDRSKKIPDVSKSKGPSKEVQLLQDQKYNSKTKSLMLKAGVVTLGVLFVIFVILVFAFVASNLNSVMSALFPNIKPTSTLSNRGLPTEIALTPTSSISAKQYFTEEFDGGIDNWSLFKVLGSKDTNEDGMTLETNDGYLTFDINTKYLYAYLYYDAYEYDNVAVEARVENHGTNTNNISLVCRHSDKGWYEFNVANSGLYDILYGSIKPDGVIGYARLANGGSTKIKSGKDVNVYKIVCKERKLSLFINGIETRTVEDTQYLLSNGKVGISASSFDQLPVKVAYDWVTISEP